MSKMSPPNWQAATRGTPGGPYERLHAVGVAHLEPEPVPKHHGEHRRHDPASDAPLVVWMPGLHLEPTTMAGLARSDELDGLVEESEIDEIDVEVDHHVARGRQEARL